MKMIFISLLNNISLLVSLSIVYYIIARRWRSNLLSTQILSGVLFGLVAILGMMNPLTLLPGLIFDGRSIIISIAGFFGGPITAIIAGILSASYRLSLGGIGAFVGVSTITSSTLIGILFYYIKQKVPYRDHPMFLYSFSFIVHLAMLTLMLLLPGGISQQVLSQISIPVLTIYPIGSLLVSLLFIELIRQYETEKKLEYISSFPELSPYPVVEFDSKGNVTYANKSMHSLLAELSIQDATLFLPQDIVQEAFSNSTSSKDKYYREIMLGDHYFAENIYIAAPFQSIRIYLTEITEKKLLEKALIEKSEELDRYFTHSLDLLCIADTDGHFRRLNPEWEKTLGYPINELVGKNFLELIHPDDLEATKQALKILDNQEAIANFTNRYRCKDGMYRWIEWRSHPIGKMIYAVARDITKAVHAQEALKESEARWQFALEGAGDGVFDWNIVTNDIFFSKQWKRMLGYEDEEIKNRLEEWQYRIHPNDLHHVMDNLQKYLDGKSHTFYCEFRMAAKDGSYKWILARGKIIHYTENGKPARLIGVHTDITNQKQAEEDRIQLERQLLHSQKLESLGMLAGGIAHDFNNLLLAIQGNLDLSLSKLNSPDELSTYLNNSLIAAQQASRLTRQMLAYSGKGQLSLQPIDINKIIEDKLPLWKSVVPKTIKMTTNLASSLSYIQGDESQIEQVIMNLISNASEAIGNKIGEIIIKTFEDDFDSEFLSKTRLEYRLPEGKYVALEISDNGIGISKAILNRLFDPFFSTKSQGRGLGMSVVMGIVKAHKGAILIDSIVNKGTTIQILFPPITNLPIPAKPEKTHPEPTLQDLKNVSSEKPLILVVDDEEVIRNLCYDILVHYGYDVITAANGKDAIEIFKNKKDLIDLAIIDLSMPEMNGIDAYKKMKEILPTIKAILTSGYNENDTSQYVDEFVGFIQKPYHMQDLQKLVEKILKS